MLVPFFSFTYCKYTYKKCKLTFPGRQVKLHNKNAQCFTGFKTIFRELITYNDTEVWFAFQYNGDVSQ